jgi:hypothetical protein
VTDHPQHFATWHEKVAVLRGLLRARPKYRAHTGPLKPIDAAVVDAKGIASLVIARHAFLQILGDVLPELVLDLAGEPLDAFARAWAEAGGPPDAQITDPGPHRESFIAVIDRLASDRKSPVQAWCRRWGLPAWSGFPDWLWTADERTVMQDLARHNWAPMLAATTISRWRVRPLTHAELGLIEPTLFATPGDLWDEHLGLEQPVRLPPLMWDPQLESRATALARIETKIGTAVRSELDRIEAAAHQANVRPALAKRTGRDHLVWLASYQCGGESYAKIARWTCRERQSVADGVRQAAELICLPLRSSGPSLPDRRPPDQH